MPRRVDEPYAVTVSLPARERDVFLAVVDRTGAASMMQLVRRLVATAADELGIATDPADFDRPPVGSTGGFNRRPDAPRLPGGKIYHPRPRRDRRAGGNRGRQLPDHPWKAKVR